MKKLISLSVFVWLFFCKSNAQCDASFTYSVSNLTVSFTPANSGSGFYHEWYIGTAYSTTSHPSVTVPYPGYCQVMHILIDTVHLCRDTAWMSFPIGAVQSTCKAQFVIIRDTTAIDLYKISSTSFSSAGAISFYGWRIDGVTIPDNGSAIVRSLTPGIHTICHAISTSSGCVDDTCQQVNIPAPWSCSFNASIKVDIYQQNPLEVHFTPVPDLPNLLYQWNFGDGSTSTVRAPVHTYSLNGQPNAWSLVKLTVMDPAIPCIKDFLQYVNVSPNCNVSFSHVPVQDSIHYIRFAITSTSINVSNGTWTVTPLNDTSNHTIITGWNPAIYFPASGSYLVCYNGVTSTNCHVTKCDTVNVSISGGRPADWVPSIPNPVVNEVEFSVELSQAGPIQISVFTSSGLRLRNLQKAGTKGINKIRIPVTMLNSGQYYVEIQTGTTRYHSLFQKLK